MEIVQILRAQLVVRIPQIRQQLLCQYLAICNPNPIELLILFEPRKHSLRCRHPSRSFKLSKYRECVKQTMINRNCEARAQIYSLKIPIVKNDRFT